MSENNASNAVLFERIGEHIALVTLNRPEARNAVNGAIAEGLDRAVRETEADPAIWAVTLTGAGEQSFCAGADLKAISAGEAHRLRTELGGFAGFVTAPRTKTWIAAVNGFALAGGLEIALSCDMIVSAEHASFGLPEVKRGLIASAGGIFRLPRAIPRAIALEMIATGESIGARRACELGLVNRVVPSSALREAALGLAEAICANAPIAVRESLKIARISADMREADLLDLTAAARERVWKTEDFREGPKAFAEKRPARWTGR